MINNKPYFHELPQDEIDKFMLNKTKWEYVIENYNQPQWCNFPGALSPYGCWSLIDTRVNGFRTNISKEFCARCPKFDKNYKGE